jgi:hypothetical protein
LTPSLFYGIIKSIQEERKKTEMTVHLMVNWREEKLITRKQYEEDEIPNAVASWENDSNVFCEWLEDNYDPYDIWEMDEDDRKSAWTKFIHYCREKALYELIDMGWEDFWIEI